MSTSWSGQRLGHSEPIAPLSASENITLVRNDRVTDRATGALYEAFIVPIQGLKMQDHRPAYVLRRVISNPNEPPEMLALDAWTVESSGRFVKAVYPVKT